MTTRQDWEARLAEVGRGPHTPLNYEQTLRKLRELMREAVRQTQYYDARWNRINDELNSHHHRTSTRDGEDPGDPLRKLRHKEPSLALKDAFGAGNWWRDKAVYLATVIQAEIALHNELGE